MSIFENIDFNNLPEDYNEICVREEIIAPLLKLLGYSSSDKSKCIVREPHLKQPFTQMGTKNIKISIIPDYLIKVNGKNFFIIEAKSPRESILSRKYIQQAYSYAFNMEVKAKYFVLCNGKEMSIYDVNNEEPVLYFKLGEASKKNWEKVYELLSPEAFTNPHIFNYKKDYGIWCAKQGMFQNLQYFYNCYISDVGRLGDDKFTFLATIKKEEELLASFDFDISLFEDFMNQVPNHLKNKVRNFVRNSPFKYEANNEEESFPLNFSAYLSKETIKNENEIYLPLIVKEFLK